MKTIINFFIACLAFLLCITAKAQTNYTVTTPAGQEVQNLYGLICCFYKINVATDADGNSYVLSEMPADSSIWVTKYDYNGNLVYNTQLVSSFSPNNRYLGKKIRVYDRVYVICRVFDPTWGESEAVFPLDKNTGAVDLNYIDFIPASGYTSTLLVDIYATGNTVWRIGQVYDGSGNSKIQVIKTDLAWTGNIYVFGNAGTNYILNTEATCFAYYNGAIYMTGEAQQGANTNILIAKMDTWGIYSEYIYSNSSYPIGGKGLRIAAESSSVYVAGAMRAQLNKPFKTTVIKMDSALTAPTWVTISAKSEWPQGFELSSTDVIYTVDYRLKVVGFSKASGMQLFAKNDFSRNAQVYNQPISTALLNNNQLAVQASVGVRIGHGPSAVNTNNKVLVKYSTSGSKVFQQMETLVNGSDYAEALGIAYLSNTDFLHEVYRLNNSLGQFVYAQGRTSATALRPVAEEIALQTQLYPNPANDYFRVSSEQKIIHCTVYDAQMREVLSVENNGYTLDANCSQWQSGLYFLRIETADGKIATQRILISK
jgi:hypothetical protein